MAAVAAAVQAEEVVGGAEEDETARGALSRIRVEEETELLWSVVEKVKWELRETVEWVWRTLGGAMERSKRNGQEGWAMVVDVRAALEDSSGLWDREATGRGVVEPLVWGSVSLGAAWVGEVAGGTVGGVLLSWWLSMWVGLVGLVAVLPGAYAKWAGAQTREMERHLGLVAVSGVLGLVKGWLVRERALVAWQPTLLAPLMAAVWGRLVGRSAGSASGERLVLLGAQTGGWTLVFVVLGLGAGTLNTPALASMTAVGAAQTAHLQILYAQQRGQLVELRLVLPILHITTILTLEALVALAIAPYAHPPDHIVPINTS